MLCGNQYPGSPADSNESKGVTIMINITDQDIAFLRKHFENADELLQAEHVNDVLDALFDLLTKKGFYGYEYNELGEETQKVYDRIYLNNT